MAISHSSIQEMLQN